MNWLGFVEMRTVNENLYYTGGDDPRFPLPSIKHDIPDKIKEVRTELADETNELEQRLSQLEYRFQEEVDSIY